MASGRIRRSARRGVAAAVLGWLGVATLSVLMAPSAAAAAQVTVTIRDLTPPVASVDAGGTVTFVNDIAPKTVRVGGGGVIPSLVDVTATTDVTLGLPSGSKPLARGASVTERFDSSCTGCTITYTYKYTSNAALTQPVIDAARALLPALPAPTPFVVNTIVPDLPNPPSVNLPPLPGVAAPPPPPVVNPVNPVNPTDPTNPVDPAQPSTEGSPSGGPTPATGPGSGYTYDTGANPRLSPSARAAAAAFDPSRFAVLGSGASGSSGSGGSGGAPGNYDGASVPVFGQLAGLDNASLDQERSAEEAAASRSDVPALPAAALAAVVALAAVTAALVRTHQANQASTGRHAPR
jgi:hypothetical protein